MLTDLVFQPRPEDHPVPHYAAGAELQRPFTEIAVVYGDCQWETPWDRIINSMRIEARRLGADALILIDRHSEVEGTTSYLWAQQESYAQGHADHYMNYGESYAYGQSDGYVYGESTGQAFGSTSVTKSRHMAAVAIRWKDDT